MLLALLSALALSALAAVPSASIAAPVATGFAASRSIDVTDDAGHHLHFDAPVERIVTLAPNLTELVFAAGGAGRLVAVTRFSDYPEGARSLAKVGDAFALNFEAIASLKPQLIVAWKSGLAQRQRERLETLGIPIFDSEIGSVEGIADTLRRLGTLMGREPLAEQAATRVTERWSALKRRYEGSSDVRVFYQLSDEPLMTVNGDHLITRTMSACGGVNAFASLPSLVPTISWEAAAQSDPQLIATASAPGRAPRLGRWPELKQVDAVAHHRYAALPPDYLSRMGPRFLDGAEALCAAIDQVRASLTAVPAAQRAISNASPDRTQRQP